MMQRRPGQGMRPRGGGGNIMGGMGGGMGMGPAAYPLGVTDDAHEGGGTFSIMPQGDRDMPQIGDPITIWNQEREGGPMARFRGEITEITGQTGSYIIHEEDVDPNWPVNVNPRGTGNSLYLAQGPTFMPNMSRIATNEEYQLMLELAKDHEEMEDIPPLAGVIGPDLRGEGVPGDYPELDDPNVVEGTFRNAPLEIGPGPAEFMEPDDNIRDAAQEYRDSSDFIRGSKPDGESCPPGLEYRGMSKEPSYHMRRGRGRFNR